MHYRRERVRIETARHEIEGTLQLPHEGFRSRMTDFLNTQNDDFLPLTDADVRWIDADREREHHEFLAVATRHVVMLVELESLGSVDEVVPTLSASSPPPGV
jgi:hypothetical protein